jgi:endoglycosylceramidase
MPTHADSPVIEPGMLSQVTALRRAFLALRAGWWRRRVGSRGRVQRTARPLVVAMVVALIGVGQMPLLPGNAAVARRPIVPLGHDGRWFTDATGRVVMLRGMNFVEKWAPFTPAADGFNDDDAALLAANGFNALRLGVPFEFVMPAPGRLDHAYLSSIADTVRILGRHGVYVLLDFHQDGWGPVTHGNGMPAWATITDGLPNPPAPFPLYYVLNPALQRAFENFWANRPGPDGVPLQTHYAAAMRAVAAQFAWSSNVLGYEAMNEPWPGANWSSCVTGCADLEARLLAPFYARMTAAVRSVDTRRPVYVEPFVLFNFGNADTSMPGAGSSNVLSTHVYALSTKANGAVIDRSVAAAERDRAALLVTEWGATRDPASITKAAHQFDARLVPWLYWSYNGLVVGDSRLPLVAPNLNVSVLDALTRPYPTLVNGTPTRLAFDPATRTLDFELVTRRPDGRITPRRLQTEVVVPKLRYPDGYAVTAVGAAVTSRPCAPTLTLRNQPGATTVTVRVTPARCP